MRPLLCGFLALLGPALSGKRDTRSSLGSRWTKRSRVDSRSFLPVRIGIAQSNLEAAHDHLMRISDPTSPDYGKHWTSDQVIEFFKPSNEAVDQVTKWLHENGIGSVTHSDNKGWLAFDAPTSMVEALLHTEYFEHHDSVTGGVMPACDEYHVPKEIQHHIDYITPGVKLMAPISAEAQGTMHEKVKRTSVANSSLDNCGDSVTPQCVAALYDIPPGNKSDPSNTLGIYETNLQFWDQEDLDNFFETYSPQIPQGTHPTDDLIDGGIAETEDALVPLYDGAEALLDLALAYPIIWPQGITVYDSDDARIQAWYNNTWTWGFNTFLDAIDGSYCTYTAYNETGDLVGLDPTYPDPLPDGYNGTLQCGVFEPTNVISLSYGGTEAAVPIAYQKRQCNEYMKLGLQGITFVFASGDNGVAERVRFTDAEATCIGPEGLIFNPSWPSTCPYVTSVGATYIPQGQTIYDPESAAIFGDDPDDTSGGGFSNVYGMPEYQKNATEVYFAEHSPDYPYYSGLVANANNPVLPNVTALAGNTGGRYNRIGRGYPDVSAIGNNITISVYDYFFNYAGTSASTPIFASIINRINEERIAIGKTPVGFINPTLYANPQMFHDITSGSNAGCDGGGFEAVQGWDPVTGLGTPDYPSMLEVFLDLP
ncbi:subtilisin-like protein [Cryphonectria parasitica EP155]|uniref:tripeptidyl-peptidase II n=1 Tax=Cryphonectria parasitica (strain ATCC 38755 / EP155) TaxID=660469 RepID=A0A9P5CJF8_CRYP1|nr:subtilisin-like protein [Cryphonectria parasitica EP155]KAF3761013.1 subtilisin-like protein [Cryphonectria parasitica EP155]